jgi:hypothetical protein
MTTDERNRRLLAIHEQVEDLAREAGETIPNLLAEILEDYGYVVMQP